jgi:hypothetical protein
MKKKEQPMTRTCHGKVSGRSIELDEDLGFEDAERSRLPSSPCLFHAVGEIDCSDVLGLRRRSGLRKMMDSGRNPPGSHTRHSNGHPATSFLKGTSCPALQGKGHTMFSNRGQKRLPKREHMGKARLRLAIQRAIDDLLQRGGYLRPERAQWRRVILEDLEE